MNTHFEVDFDPAARTLTGRALREFPDHPRIEGVAADGQGRFFYVSDENSTVHLRCTPLLAAAEDASGQRILPQRSPGR